MTPDLFHIEIDIHMQFLYTKTFLYVLMERRYGSLRLEVLILEDMLIYHSGWRKVKVTPKYIIVGDEWVVSLIYSRLQSDSFGYLGPHQFFFL